MRQLTWRLAALHTSSTLCSTTCLHQRMTTPAALGTARTAVPSHQAHATPTQAVEPCHTTHVRLAVKRKAWARSSNSGSEAVTKLLLASAGVLTHSGVPPAGIAAFASAASARGAGPTCTRCTIAPVSGSVAEQLSDALLGFGAQSVMVEEHRQPGAFEQERYGQDAELWDSCSVVAHFELEHDIDATLTVAAEVLEIPLSRLQYTMEPVGNEEWVEQIKASYVPLRISERLHIVPEGHPRPDDPGAVSILLQPGVAFGTGEHPTTRLCLQRLSDMDLAGCSVMDYGTGSGVLAIGALLLGATRAVGTDTDPLAVRSAQYNAQANSVAERFSVVRCAPTLDSPDPLEQLGLPTKQRLFELVVANILRGPLVELAPRLGGYVAPGGQLLLSGILAEQVPDIVDAYSQLGFDGWSMHTDGCWAAVSARRPRR